MNRLGPASAAQCAMCKLPLHTVRGDWCAQMPLGIAAWLCLPCAYLHRGKPDGFEIPDKWLTDWTKGESASD